MRLIQSIWRNAQINAVNGSIDEVQPDDDASLYRLFGFSLFVAIRFRRKVLYGSLRRLYTLLKRKQYLVELNVLKSLIETDKSILPVIIRSQDRGKMTFPHRVLLPFMRNCSIDIKKFMNCDYFKINGKSTIIQAKKSVRSNQKLIQEFATLINFQCRNVSIEAVQRVYVDVVQRVINMMGNSFLQSQAMLERITSNKGTDAQMALRDKLKAYSTDLSTRIKL